MLRIALLSLVLATAAQAAPFRPCWSAAEGFPQPALPPDGVAAGHPLAPSAVLIRRQTPDQDGNLGDLQMCGGSLIADKWVLTARHCVEFKNWAWVTVGAGSAIMDQPGRGAYRRAVAAFCPPGSEKFALPRDLALLALESPMPADIPRLEITDVTHAMGLASPVRGIIGGYPAWRVKNPPTEIDVRRMFVEGRFREEFLLVTRERRGDQLQCSGESGSIFVAPGPRAYAVLTAIIDRTKPDGKAKCNEPTGQLVMTPVAGEEGWIRETIRDCDADPVACLSRE